MPSVVIGLDGAAWQLLDPLIDDGIMPRLAALRARGASGTLSSTVPPVTPPAWTSSFTGVNPGRHGIYGFHRGNAQSERQEMMHSGQVKAPTVWEIANAQGATMGVYNLPLTYPPRELDGWMVSGMMTPGIGQHLSGFVFPEALEQQVLSWVPDYVVEIKANQEQDWRDEALAERALASLHQRRTVLQRLLEERPCDLLFAVLETPDRLQHLYYRYMDPEEELYHSSAGARIRPSINRCFQVMDEIVGLLDDYAGPGGGVIVCSDHGFTAWEASVHTNALLESWGYLTLKRGARAVRNPVVAKAALAARRFLPVKVRRRARQQTFAAIDWSRTKAFASVYYQQGVFVNLAGRERFGTVAPSDLDTVKEEIAARFTSLRGPDGELVTDRVWRSQEVFHGDALEGAPDLVVEVNDSRWQLDDEIFHPHPFTEFLELPRGGHHPDGIVVIAGPGVPPGHTVAGTIMDVTPTLLYLSGLRVPEGLDGSVIQGAFDDDHTRDHPVESIPPLSSAPRDESSPYSEAEEKVIEDTLRGLGYI